jgi:hypothetical protein
MRRLTSLALAAAAVAGAAARVGALEPVKAAQTGQSGPAQAQGSRQAVPGQIRTEVALLRLLHLDEHVPPTDSFIIGGRTIRAGETVPGIVAVARGPLEVRGRIDGNALALHGDIIIHPGGVIRGDAVAIGGHVRARGGVVEGNIRSVAGLLPMAAGSSRQGDASGSTWQAIKVVLGWFAILLVIGIGVLVFAESTFDPVVESLQERFGRAFWYGLLAQLATIPVLLAVLIALALTVVGILLIPFAIVAYAVALAGLLTLGFLAVARFTGAAITARRSATPAKRGASLRALVAGLAIYLGLWLAAAAFSWSPLAGSLLRAAALAVTWVAVTLGLGALIASRVALRRVQSSAGHSGAADPMVWQTPTPVTGVAAARRPVSAARSELN